MYVSNRQVRWRRTEMTKEILKEKMENAIKLRVPLIAEVSEATNWYDCK